VSIQVSLAGLLRAQAVIGVGARFRTAFTCVQVARAFWPRGRLKRLNLLICLNPDGRRPLARGRGAPPALTLRAAPGLALLAVTPAHPYRLLDHRDKGYLLQHPQIWAS